MRETIWREVGKDESAKAIIKIFMHEMTCILSKMITVTRGPLIRGIFFPYILICWSSIIHMTVQ